jgi:pimeloyl-ACP methyl ester carboxylesterase
VSDVPRTLYASEGDLRIAYQVVGRGSLDLVFAPGGQIPVDLIWEEPGCSRFLQRLSSFSRMVLFDSRGWGASRTTTETAPTFEAWPDDLRLVMDTVGIERAAVVGFLAGAVFSIHFAATHPERVSSLVLLESFARMLRDADYPAGITPAALDNGTRAYVEGYGSGQDLADLPECCIAGADGRPWPCRSAWVVAFRRGSLDQPDPWAAQTAASSPVRKRPPRSPRAAASQSAIRLSGATLGMVYVPRAAIGATSSALCAPNPADLG